MTDPKRPTDLTVVAHAETRRSETEAPPVELGQWYWVKDEDRKKSWLGCVIYIGTNFVKMAKATEYHNNERIHENEFDARCTFEPNPEPYIQKQVAGHQAKVNQLLDKVKRLTASLGITRPALGTGTDVSAPTQALVKLHGVQNVKTHKKALIKAKEKTLPELFKQVEKEHEAMARWMKASLLPHMAQSESLKAVTESIEDRIFAVELYAGLIEELVRIKDGNPAPDDTKISLFQRRHFMDEECLVNYQAGGMDLRDIKAFDKWLTRPENLERILPFARSVVAFRVRRIKKDRPVYSLKDFIQVMYAERDDRRTFLYFRNGEQVFRLSTGIDFGDELFPRREDSLLLGDRQEELWANIYWHKVGEIISGPEMRQRLEDQAAEQEKYEAKLAAWHAENNARPEDERRDDFFAPSDPRHYRSEKWVRIGKDSVYFDDVMKCRAQEAMTHNRLAMVLQGLLDRSPAFHPHPPWQLFTPEGFSMGIELIYDASRVLTDGDAPDFEAYRRALNQSITQGTMTTGQELAWLRAEAKKENRRQENDWRVRNPTHYETYRPHGNPGPGLVAPVVRITKSKGTCRFEWERERHRYNPWNPNLLKVGFTCPTSVLLNVDAYRPGDFKKFYADPRTRADYAQWAPLLLAAEDWHVAKKGKHR